MAKSKWELYYPNGCVKARATLQIDNWMIVISPVDEFKVNHWTIWFYRDDKLIWMIEDGRGSFVACKKAALRDLEQIRNGTHYRVKSSN